MEYRRRSSLLAHGRGAAEHEHTQDQAANLSVPELVGAITGFCCENDALGECK